MKPAPFQDHFSGIASQYAQFRPRYPSALFEYLASLSLQRKLAWDCATGSGQSATALAAEFELVIATDASEQQIANAEPHPRVLYRTAPAENSGIDAESVNLIAVAQALHWFDLPAFYTEVRRVLKPDGVLAVWSYGPMVIEDAAIQKLLDRFYYEVVGPYWPPERKLVDEGYRSLVFPFARVEAPEFTMESAMVPEDIAGYLGTWSATQKYRQAEGQDPVPGLIDAITGLWDDPDLPMTVEWPLVVRIGRNTPD